MVSIPIDIITNEILPKLPAKSLVRFKCVSKSFNILISSSEFIDIHLRQSLSSNGNRLLILTKEYSTDLYSFDIDSPDCDTTAINIPLPRTLGKWLDDNFVSIVGSVNGLLCVGLTCDIDETREYKQVVINPSTGVFREVPHKHTPTLGYQFQTVVTFGFGFDDINHDYKLVRIVENIIHYDAHGGRELENREVMVYSLNENTWNLVEKVDRPTHSLWEIDHCGVVLNNHLLHWICWGYDRCDILIYCFDVRSDKWGDKLPLVDLVTDPMYDFNEDYEDMRLKVRNLGVLDGCLCFTAESNLSNVVWMMKDYGVKESWIKLFEISRTSRYYFDGPYGFRQGSKLEVLVRKSRWTDELFWCYVGSEADNRIEVISGIPVYDQACFFTGSLVSIPGSKPIISPED
ncbi:F-box protein CPR1-like [Silene latifolia]|uniref:F-box protein CPR1-like n=1 Tax=Silene latifolia TaxID=37657 RepID=UPI003D7799E3